MLNKPGWQLYLFCTKNLMIKLNLSQKNRAEHGAGISKEKQTLLSKRREKLQSKRSHAWFYIWLNLKYVLFLINSPKKSAFLFENERHCFWLPLVPWYIASPANNSDINEIIDCRGFPFLPGLWRIKPAMTINKILIITKSKNYILSRLFSLPIPAPEPDSLVLLKLIGHDDLYVDIFL